MASTSPSSRHRRHEVEIYAHALRARLQLASFKALNGVGKSSLFDLDASATPSSIKPLTTSLVENKDLEPQLGLGLGLGISSTASTPAMSQGESLPSSSQSSTRSTRSIYMDIFGTDFRSAPASSSSGSSSKGFSRVTSFATSSSTPSKRRASTSASASAAAPSSSSTSTKSLLDKAASSPQLGSPERKNGRFDWHNNPTPAMVAHESKLAAEEAFALPTGSPSKRRREASHNPSTSTGHHLLGQPSTPRRSRMQSSGFLPNGHPASSLAADLGLTGTPRTPRSRHASGRHVFAVQPQSSAAALEQDQAERDRVANTLAALAEARNAEKSASSSDSSSGSDRPHTPPPSRQAGLGFGFASPSMRRGSAFAHPTSNASAAAKKHRRNVSWSVLPAGLNEDEGKAEATEEQNQGGGEDDRAAADYLLFLASSPSPSSIKRFSSDTEESVGTNGILSTPAQNSLWDSFKDEPISNSGGRRSRMHSQLIAGPRHISNKTPLTPPPSSRKLPKPSSATSSEVMVGLGFDAATLSSSASSSPSGSPRKPAANAEEYMLSNTPRSPRTPPSSSHFASSATFDNGFFPTTPPNAPGGDTTFHYADFVNVSPSPQPPSTGRFPGASMGGYVGMSHRTPTKSNRFRFDPRHT